MLTIQPPETLTDVVPDMLDTLVEASEFGAERKRDGKRCLVKLPSSGRIQAISRTMKKFPLPDEIEAKLKAVKRTPELQGKDIILDGEIVWVDEDGQDHRSEAQAGENPYPCYTVWTIQDMDLTYYERKRILLDLCNFNSWNTGKSIEFQPLYVKKETKQKLVKQGKKEGWEGYVFKKLDSKYLSGRNPDSLRWKYRTTEDYIVIGYTDSDKKKNPFRALVLARYDAKTGELLPRGQCGGGFPDLSEGTEKATRTEIWDQLLDDKPYWRSISRDRKTGKIETEVVGKKKKSTKHNMTDKDYRKSYGNIRFLYPKDWFTIELISQGHTEYGVPFMAQFIRLRKDKPPALCKENE